MRLAHNFKLLSQLRRSYEMRLKFLFAGCMLISFVPIGFFASWLAGKLGITMSGTPMIDQPNSLLWLVLFLGFATISVYLAYLASFRLLGLILRRRGWSAERVERLIQQSEVPAHWLKPS